MKKKKKKKVDPFARSNSASTYSDCFTLNKCRKLSHALQKASGVLLYSPICALAFKKKKNDNLQEKKNKVNKKTDISIL